MRYRENKTRRQSVLHEYGSRAARHETPDARSATLISDLSLQQASADSIHKDMHPFPLFSSSAAYFSTIRAELPPSPMSSTPQLPFDITPADPALPVSPVIADCPILHRRAVAVVLPVRASFVCSRLYAERTVMTMFTHAPARCQSALLKTRAAMSRASRVVARVACLD